jgi:hypothetical protein
MTCGCYTITRAIELTIQEIFSATRHRDVRSPTRSSSRVREIESFKDQAEISGIDLDARRVAGRKPERPALEAFVEKAKPTAREKENLEPIASAVAEGEEMTGQRVLFENLSSESGQAVEAATQIDRGRGHEDPDTRGDREHHFTGRRDKIATVSSTRVTPATRKNTPPGSSTSILPVTALG